MSKREIKNLIGLNKTEEAIEKLCSLANNKYYNEVLILKSKFTFLKRDKLLYLESRNKLSVEYNQLNNSLLVLTDEIFLPIKKEPIYSEMLDLEMICNDINNIFLRYLLGGKEDLSKKFIPDLYVKRNHINEVLIKFFSQNEYNCFALTGVAGIGKTNFICNLVNSKYTDTHFLFIDGKYISTSIFEEILRTFDKIPTSSFSELLSFLKTTLDKTGKKLVIVIDAINESSHFRKLKIEIPKFLDKIIQSKVNIKLLISCRDIDWVFFSRGNRKLFSHLFSGTSFREMDNLKNFGSILINEFDKEMFCEMWKRYSTIYDLKGNPNDKIRKICQHPLMMRFLAEGFRGVNIPTDINRLEILEKYWEKKLLEPEIDSSGRNLLFKVVERMRYSKTNELPSENIEELTGESLDSISSIINRALSENIVKYIFYFRNVGKSNRKYISFTYESFQEYVLAKSIYWSDDWDRKTSLELETIVTNLVKESTKYRSLIGAIEFLVLMCEGRQDKVFHCLIKQLISSGALWQKIACLLLLKVKTLDKELIEIYNPIAYKGSWQRRKLFAQSLANRIKDSDFIRLYIYEDLTECLNKCEELNIRRGHTSLSKEQRSQFKGLNFKITNYVWLVDEISEIDNKLTEKLIEILLSCVYYYEGIVLTVPRGERPSKILCDKITLILEKILKNKNKLSKNLYTFISRIPSSNVRLDLDKFLKNQKDKHYVKILRQFVSEDFEDIQLLNPQMNSAVFLAESGYRSVYKYLVRGLSLKYDDLKILAISGLGELGLEKSSKELVNEILKSNDYFWITTLEALTRIRATDQVYPILYFLARQEQIKHFLKFENRVIKNSRNLPHIVKNWISFELSLRNFIHLKNKKEFEYFLKEMHVNGKSMKELLGIKIWLKKVYEDT